MSAADLDIRPFADPDCFSYRELEECDYRAFAEHCRTAFPDCQWGRFTVVSPEFPMPPYPDGWYFEGWTVNPAKMVPPHREAPFNYPLSSQEPRP